MSPLVRNALPSFETMDIVGIVERTLKLAVPNLYFWLCGARFLSVFPVRATIAHTPPLSLLPGFYAFFHLWLSVVAELLRFADREFYRDWVRVHACSFCVFLCVCARVYLCVCVFVFLFLCVFSVFVCAFVCADDL